MASLELDIRRSSASETIVQTLPDGSLALVEVATKNVYSLNASAAAAWEACASATTLSRLAAAMSVRLGTPVSEDLAHEAVSELVAAGLVSITPGINLGPSRRELLRQAAVALPVVLVLTGLEQRAHAQGAGSGPTTTTTTTTVSPGTTTSTTTTTTTSTTTTTTTSTTTSTTTVAPQPPTRRFRIWKLVGDSLDAPDKVPLAGADFEVIVVATGQLVGHLITDAGGIATIDLTPNVEYRIVEVAAPPSLDVYEAPIVQQFVMQNKDDFGFNLTNVLRAQS